MPDIITVFACLSQCLNATTLRQLGRVTEAMLAMTGRVTMRGIARWAGPGGSYRTGQRLFTTRLSWGKLQWLLIRHHLLDQDDVILMGGDEVVVTKSGKRTYGLDRFFPHCIRQLKNSKPHAGNPHENRGGARSTNMRHHSSSTPTLDLFSRRNHYEPQDTPVVPGDDRTL